MSDIMLLGVLGMPWPEEWEAACPDQLWLMQFKDRLQQAREELDTRADRILTLERELAATRRDADYWREMVEAHNTSCEWQCNDRAVREDCNGDYCRHMRAVGRECTDCPRDWQIIIDAAIGSLGEPAATEE